MTELEEIRGIGNSIAEKLEDAGITSINQLANTSVDELDAIGVPTAEKIHRRARKVGATIKNGETVEKEQANPTFATTGMQSVDRMLGGGLEGGYLIGVSGEHKAGKTQFALQSLAATADTTDGHCVYIETEPNRFRIDRIKSLCRKDDSYKHIHKVEAYDPDSDTDNLALQRNAYDAVREHFDDLAIVVVDSFVANFRLSSRFEGRGDLKERSNVIGNHLESLQSLANGRDCPVLITLQVYGNPKQYDSTVPIWGGALMHHTITYLVHMAHSKGEIREAQLKGHPAQPDNSAEIKIPENAPIQSNE